MKLSIKQYVGEIFLLMNIDYKREINKSRDALKTKYCNLFNILNRVKQGNLSRSEIVNLYSQARRFILFV